MVTGKLLKKLWACKRRRTLENKKRQSDKRYRACYGGEVQGADRSLDRPGRKQATATEDFDVHISYL
jgi:hypothetical protein